MVSFMMTTGAEEEAVAEAVDDELDDVLGETGGVFGILHVSL